MLHGYTAQSKWAFGATKELIHLRKKYSDDKGQADLINPIMDALHNVEEGGWYNI